MRLQKKGVHVLVGYAGVSTHGQDFTLQGGALKQGGNGRVFKDAASRAKAARLGLIEAIDYLHAGDTLVV